MRTHAQVLAPSKSADVVFSNYNAHACVSLDMIDNLSMTEYCPNKLECILPSDLTSITGVCPADRKGIVCGPPTTFDLVLDQFQKMETEDAVNPIHGTFEVVREPLTLERSGKHLVGCVFPVRKPLDEVRETQEVVVSFQDLALTSLMHGLLEIPELCKSQNIAETNSILLDRPSDDGSRVIGLKFGELTPVDDMTSIDFYSQFLADYVKYAMLNTLFIRRDGQTIPNIELS